MRSTDPDRGYATTVVRQMEDCLGLAMDAGAKILVNAGGLNPAVLADRLRELSKRLGVAAENAHVEGDDLLAGPTSWGTGPRSPPTSTWERLESRRRSTPDPTWW